MVILNHKYNEGDTVWFVDEDANSIYSERGTIIAFKKNGDMVINFYAGMMVFAKESIFPTKEECEKHIYLSKIAKELKDGTK